jgi:formate-dependent nitrite reductase membrane component NrfD
MMQVKPWDFMVKYTPQREWIEGHGILVAIAMFLGGVSGGLYLASLYFNSMPGMFIAWLLAMAAGVTDMAHLSKPLRFWRMMLKPGTSWISRGFILIWLFLGGVAIQLALGFWFPGTALETVFRVLSGILAFGVAIYSGFVVGYVGAIKLWNSAIVPILYVVAGIASGLAVLVALNLGNPVPLASLVGMMQVVLVVFAVFLGIYLWVATYESISAKDAVRMVVKGNIAPAFWIGLVLLGFVVPLAILFTTSAAVMLIIAAACTIIGSVTLRYVILKAGMYVPLVSG